VLKPRTLSYPFSEGCVVICIPGEGYDIQHPNLGFFTIKSVIGSLMMKDIIIYLHVCIPGEGYIDAEDANWTKDKELVALDLNTLTSRQFVVYKFGCFISELLVRHCGHSPVTLLLASRIPPNAQLPRNAYRNSFRFDGTSRVLYMRAARLDAPGRFLLVLAHTLAHIKAGE
jgi:hypothetical protein